MAVRKLTTGKWLCECYPAGRSGRRVRKQFAPKAKHWLLSVTRWKKPKQSPGWVNQWIVEH